MPTYLELKEQAERLLAQAEEVREKEIADAIADIKAKIEAYGLTAQDLGLSAGGGSGAPRGRPAKAAKAAKSAKAKAPAKYRGPNGQTWSGGRGRKPQWVVDALANGKSLDDFRI
jgi:DNA-binding protein H-NS